MEAIKRFYREVFHVQDEALVHDLSEISYFLTFPKGGILLRQGEVPAQLCFLAQGAFRGYYVDEAGREVTDCFVVRPEIPPMPIEYTKPSCVSFEAIERSLVVAAPLEQALTRIAASEEGRALFARVTRESALLNVTGKQQLHHPAAERYAWFCREYPQLEGRVPDRMVASYLGMTPITLSRMRHQKPRDEAELPSPEQPLASGETPDATELND